MYLKENVVSTVMAIQMLKKAKIREVLSANPPSKSHYNINKFREISFSCHLNINKMVLHNAKSIMVRLTKVCGFVETG